MAAFDCGCNPALVKVYEAIPIGMGDAGTTSTQTLTTLAIPSQVTLQAAGVMTLGGLLLGLAAGYAWRGGLEPTPSRQRK
jgi:hypothetical protein